MPHPEETPEDPLLFPAGWDARLTPEQQKAIGPYARDTVQRLIALAGDQGPEMEEILANVFTPQEFYLQSREALKINSQLLRVFPATVLIGGGKGPLQDIVNERLRPFYICRPDPTEGCGFDMPKSFVAAAARAVEDSAAKRFLAAAGQSDLPGWARQGEKLTGDQRAELKELGRKSVRNWFAVTDEMHHGDLAEILPVFLEGEEGIPGLSLQGLLRIQNRFRTGRSYGLAPKLTETFAPFLRKGKEGEYRFHVPEAFFAGIREAVEEENGKGREARRQPKSFMEENDPQPATKPDQPPPPLKRKSVQLG